MLLLLASVKSSKLIDIEVNGKLLSPQNKSRHLGAASRGGCRLAGYTADAFHLSMSSSKKHFSLTAIASFWYLSP